MSGPLGSSAATGAVTSGRLVAAAVSECGPVRRENQDAFRLVEIEGGGLGLIVADGMGGHAGGGEAAEAAIAAAAERMTAPAADAEDLLRASVDDANRAVIGVRRQLGGNPGTTMVAAILSESRLLVANVGDSRAYLVGNGVVRQLSEDHSLVAEQVRAGTMDAATARHDPRRNYITRALLGDPVEPDITETAVAAGDVVLLCSDGLWEPLADAAIADILGAPGSLGEASRRLVTAAIEAGSLDNVTAVCARIEPR